MITAITIALAMLFLIAAGPVAFVAWVLIGVAWACTFASILIALAIACVALASRFTAQGCR